MLLVSRNMRLFDVYKAECGSATPNHDARFVEQTIFPTMGIKMKIEMQSPQRTKVDLRREIPDLMGDPRFRLLRAEASRIGLSRGHTSSSGALEAVSDAFRSGDGVNFMKSARSIL